MKSLYIVANKPVKVSNTCKSSFETEYHVSSGLRLNFETKCLLLKRDTYRTVSMSSRLTTRTSTNVHLCDGTSYVSNNYAALYSSLTNVPYYISF